VTTIKSTGDRVPSQQARTDHHRGIRGVGAARDGGDHNRAVMEVERGRRRIGISSLTRDRNTRGLASAVPAVDTEEVGEVEIERRLGTRQRDPSLGQFGSGQRRLDCG
jgi:hypothetical protein